MSPQSKLIDEFRERVKTLGLSVPGELEEIGCFGDLVWRRPGGPYFDIQRFQTEDPAFQVMGYSRYVAFWRVESEIRYFAAPNVSGAHQWYWNGTDPKRRAAVDAESDYSEIGILPTLDDVVHLTMEYLNGKALAEIVVRRIKPQYG